MVQVTLSLGLVRVRKCPTDYFLTRQARPHHNLHWEYST